jgi:hypothetical protein
MFAGIPSSFLLPILDEKYVVSQIVHAIRTDKVRASFVVGSHLCGHQFIFVCGFGFVGGADDAGSGESVGAAAFASCVGVRLARYQPPRFA